jgi:cyclic pyranopterin phosphate synthase
VTTRLSHLDDAGRARMVDVSAKDATTRTAVARGRVRMQPATLEQIAAGSMPKGDVLAVARLAGIMGAKRTPELIPLCHPLPLDAVDVDLTPDPAEGCVRIVARARVHARTGVEMEALTAVAVAALTLYDMCKAVDRAMTIEDVCLVEKQGGKSGPWVRPD